MAISDGNLNADILSQLSSSVSSYTDTMSSVSSGLESLYNEFSQFRNEFTKYANSNLSQSAAKDRSKVFNEEYKRKTRDKNNSGWNKGSRSSFRDGPGLSAGFFDNFEEELLKGFLGSDFRDQISDTFEGLAKNFGINIKDIPGSIGKNLGKYAMDAFKQTNTGKAVTGAVQGLVNKGLSFVGDLGNSLLGGGKGVGGLVNSALGKVLGSGGAGVAAASGSATAASGLATLGPELATLGPSLAAIAPIGVAVVGSLILLKKAFGNVIESAKAVSDAWKEVKKSLKAASRRDIEERKEYTKAAIARMEADVKSFVEYPFKILQEAAEDLQSAWKENLSTINQTQGLTKDDTMSLMSSLAQRLRDEGLSSVISGSDIVSSLTKVLEAGLSGKIAEEFAYQAVKLNKAVPTQDFFNFASNYASIAANAVKNGQSQEAAINAANESLYSFTNNLLYASRELAGGFTTGLADATEIYSKSVKIAQAARIGDTNEISGVLTSVSAIVGAIAPDLAGTLVDTLYKAATGGNSSEIVALRSLAGINASNTEFIRAFASNPKGVITTMFNNLGTIFSQSEDAYMEKAEGYASLFGLSSEAFQRIDFNYLAQQISGMNVQSSALNDNLTLLASGQSTYSKEQQKIAEINRMMIDEGLSYVIDNELGQMIQQHMWDEQMQRQLVESTFSVNIVGSAVTLLEKIASFIENLLRLNPIYAAYKIVKNLKETVDDGKTNGVSQSSIAAVLEAGRVGRGNASALYSLISRNRDLRQQLLGGRSALDMILSARSGSSTARNYSWGGLTSKGDAASVRNLLGSMLPANTASSISNSHDLSSSGAAVVSSLAPQFSNMLATMDSYVTQYKSYEDWAATAGQYGISDLVKVAQESGYSEDQLRLQYDQLIATHAGQEEYEILQKEIAFYDTMTLHYAADTGLFWTNFSTPLTENLLLIHEKQDELYDLIDEYVVASDKLNKEWEKHWKEYADYYLYHKVYSGDVLNLDKLRRVQIAEKDEEGDLMTSLSKYLSSNDWDLEDFKDPQLQANALLAKILIVVTSIMNQTNETVGSVSLADSLAALSMGMTTTVDTSGQSGTGGYF